MTDKIGRLVDDPLNRLSQTALEVWALKGCQHCNRARDEHDRHMSDHVYASFSVPKPPAPPPRDGCKESWTSAGYERIAEIVEDGGTFHFEPVGDEWPEHYFVWEVTT